MAKNSDAPGLSPRSVPQPLERACLSTAALPSGCTTAHRHLQMGKARHGGESPAQGPSPASGMTSRTPLPGSDPRRPPLLSSAAQPVPLLLPLQGSQSQRGHRGCPPLCSFTPPASAAPPRPRGPSSPPSRCHFRPAKYQGRGQRQQQSPFTEGAFKPTLPPSPHLKDGVRHIPASSVKWGEEQAHLAGLPCGGDGLGSGKVRGHCLALGQCSPLVTSASGGGLSTSCVTPSNSCTDRARQALCSPPFSDSGN